MATQLLAIVIFGSLFGAALLFASKHSSKAAQLDALKAELRKLAEEEKRAEKVKNTVYSMSADDARRRLCELQSKQR